MANKKAIYTFGGANQDISKAKHQPQYYFDAQHIRILATDAQSTVAAKNEKGNTQVISLPDLSIDRASLSIIYGDKTLQFSSAGDIINQVISDTLPLTSDSQVIIGHTETRQGLVLFSTDNAGFDCVWHIPNILDGSYDLTLLYVRNLGFSTDNPIQALFNYENDNIQKVYWVDGVNQLRYLNITHNSIEGNDPLIDLPSTTINLVGAIDFSQPKITDTLIGGDHTAGVIQYGYNLLRLNGSQTKLSPLTDLVALDKGPSNGGGELNEEVATTPVITIENIDQNYNIIKLYGVKYTSYNQIPEIFLIEEREINSSNMVFYDNGSFIETLSLEEFLFLGSDPIIPEHIATKDNRLFFANIKDSSFDIPKDLDFRAYSFPINSDSTRVYNNPQLTNSDTPNLNVNVLNVDNTYNVPLNHDAVNLEYDVNRYQINSEVLGGTGNFVQYELVRKTADQLENAPDEYKFLKDLEIYRIGIEFYNELGQISPTKWIADFRAPEGNLEGLYNTLKVELLPSFYDWLNNYIPTQEYGTPVGYRIVRAERTNTDKTIITQGTITQFMEQVKSENTLFYSNQQNRADASPDLIKMPIPVSRGFVSNMNPLNRTEHLRRMNLDSDYYIDPSVEPNLEFQNAEIFHAANGSDRRAQSWQNTTLYQIINV